jgi:hypothetical protein
MRARRLYQVVNEIDPNIFRKENVDGIKSFGKIVNQFGDVKSIGPRPKLYDLEK